MKNKKINNFIKPSSKKERNKKIIKRVLKFVVIPVTIIFLMFFIFYLIYKDNITSIYNYGITGKNSFYNAQEYVIDQDFEKANESLEIAISSFESANDEYQALRWLRIIPYLGNQLNALEKILSAGISTGESLMTISDIANEIITPLQKDEEISLSKLSEEETELLLKNIVESKPSLEEAKIQIDEAVDYVESINSRGLIGKLKEVISPLQEKIPQLQHGIDVAISASQILPWIGGHPDTNTYLFLLENNSEIRPTGGFIGTYGILKVKNGDIQSFTTDNTYNLDEPAKDWVFEDPPWPLTRYNAVHNWYFRDSNWSPDYPTAAQKAEYFYDLERGPEKNINGVIAVTPTFIQSLLNLTGPITVSGLEFDSDNLVDTLQYQVDRGFLSQGLDESERKEIIGVLSKEILDRVLELPRSKWPDLWKIFNKDIEEKQILIYSKDESIQNFIEKENWGGKIYNPIGDYLAIIDANLASLKTDPYVKRTINYSINRDGNNFIANLEIKYNNTAKITWKTTRYRTYTRVYVPKGSNLLTSTGAMVDCKINEEGDISKEEELEKSVFGAFICVEPGEEKTIVFKYILPATLNDEFDNLKYQLMIQKQAGASNHELNLNINLHKNPNNMEINSIVDNDVKSDILINSILSEDQLITVNY
ncbi:MAG: DUF4012 domain-containing protein [bacterium]|nr:DUF4012 domain-containing protein [bacterium]